MQKEIITHNNAVFLLQLYFAICFYLTVTISIHSQSAERKGKSQKKILPSISKNLNDTYAHYF